MLPKHNCSHFCVRNFFGLSYIKHVHYGCLPPPQKCDEPGFSTLKIWKNIFYSSIARPFDWRYFRSIGQSGHFLCKYNRKFSKKPRVPGSNDIIVLLFSNSNDQLLRRSLCFQISTKRLLQHTHLDSKNRPYLWLLSNGKPAQKNSHYITQSGVVAS